MGAIKSTTSHEIRIEVSSAMGESATVAGTLWEPANATQRDLPTLVCLPGGSYNRGYFDLVVPGRAGYSFAEYASSQGYSLLCVDLLGTGASSRPLSEISLMDQAGAIAHVVNELPRLTGRTAPAVAVAHSMGGHVAVTQQAEFGSYAAIAPLGCTTGVVATLPYDEKTLEAARTAAGRNGLVESALPYIAEQYSTADRSSFRSWFHLDDVPQDVYEADDTTTLTVAPRKMSAQAGTPWILVDAAKKVRVPVFLAFGAVDVSADPYQEPAAYSNSDDITLTVLGRSAHCHNMSSDRFRLWDRLLGWAAAIPR